MFFRICTESADGFEGFFLFEVQLPGALCLGPVRIDAVPDGLGHRDALFKSEFFEPFDLLGMKLDLGSDHKG